MRHKGVVVSGFAVLMSACQGPGLAPNGGLTPPGGTRGGFVELDENTDPRFVHYGRRGRIGTLQVDGPSVYLNRNVVRGMTPVYNNAYVYTQQRSGARVEFSGSRRGCRIGILKLQEGNLYGDSDACVHQVETRHGVGRGDGPAALYHVSAFADRTVFTVIRGVVEVWTWSNAAQRVPVGRSEEAVLTPTGIIGPRPVSRADIRRRTAWRKNYVFGSPDLAVTQVSAPYWVQAGQAFEVEVEVANQGDAQAPGTRQGKRSGYMIDVVLSADARLPQGFSKVSARFREDSLLRGGRISNTDTLRPRQRQTYATRVTVPRDTPAGRYCVGAVADPGGTVQESDERNNDRCHWIRIGSAAGSGGGPSGGGGGRADLKVDRVEAPSTVEPGQSFKVQVTVTNGGDAKAPGTKQADRDGYMIDVVISEDSRLPSGFSKVSSRYSEDALLRGGRISNTGTLGPGRSRSYATKVTLPADTRAGRLCLGAVVDPGRVVRESNEKNNDRCRWIRIQPIIY
jgi:hypothetical protein